MSGALTERRRRAIDAMGLGPIWLRRDAAAVDLDEPSREPSQEVGDASGSRRIQAFDRQTRPDGDADRVGSLAQAAGDIIGVGVERPICLVVADPPDDRGGAVDGPGGRLLEAMLASIGLSLTRDAQVVAVALAPRPVDGADWRTTLDRRIATLSPKMILAVGREAITMLFGRDPAAVRGTALRLTVEGREIPVVATHDPAHLLDHAVDKAQAWQDLCLARELCEAQSIEAEH